MEFNGIEWDFMEFNGIEWDLFEIDGISCHFRCPHGDTKLKTFATSSQILVGKFSMIFPSWSLIIPDILGSRTS